MKSSLLKKCFLLVGISMLSLSVNAEKVLFLTNRADAGNPSDATVVQALEDEGYDVTIKLSQSFDVTDLEDVDMIYLSEAIGSGDPVSLYAAELAGKINVGIINCEPYGYNQTDRFPWCDGARKGTTDYGRLFVTEDGAAHDIFKKIGVTEASLGEEGSILLLEGNDGAKPKMAYVGIEDASRGQVLATDGTEENTKALIVAFEKGSDLGKGLTAQGRRLNFCIANQNQSLTEDGVAVLLSCVEWVIAGNELIDSTGINNVLYKDGNIFVGDKESVIELYDVQGKLCKTVSGKHSMDCSGLSQGVYIARVKGATNKQTIKITIE